MTEQAADFIRARIVLGELPLGEPLSEVALAAELRVSKTPVREALMKLKNEGLVEVHPQRGTFVFAIAPPQVSKLSELRTILESAALLLALRQNAAALEERWSGLVEAMRVALAAADAERYRMLDGAFHRSLFELAENPYLLDTYGLIAFRVQALRNRLSRDAALNRTSFDDHVALLGLVRERATTRTKALLVRHIEWTRAHYLDAMEARSEPAGRPVLKPRRRSLTAVVSRTETAPRARRTS